MVSKLLIPYFRSSLYYIVLLLDGSKGDIAVGRSSQLRLYGFDDRECHDVEETILSFGCLYHKE